MQQRHALCFKKYVPSESRTPSSERAETSMLAETAPFLPSVFPWKAEGKLQICPALRPTTPPPADETLRKPPPLPFIVHVVRGILPERASIAVIPEGRIQFFGGQTGWWPVAYDRAAGTVFSAVQMHTILLALSRSFSEYTGKSGDVFLLMMSLFWLRRSEGYAKNSRNFFLCSQAPVIP